MPLYQQILWYRKGTEFSDSHYTAGKLWPREQRPPQGHQAGRPSTGGVGTQASGPKAFLAGRLLENGKSLGVGVSVWDSLPFVCVGCSGTPVIFVNKLKPKVRFLEEASDFVIPKPKSKGCISALD